MESRLLFHIGLVVLVVLVVQMNFGNSLDCYSCQGGYRTPCSRIVPRGMSQDCEDANAQCYVAVVWYQGSALKLVQRRCYTPGADGKDFCTSPNSTTGVIQSCQTCTTDLCNSAPLFANETASCTTQF